MLAVWVVEYPISRFNLLGGQITQFTFRENKWDELLAVCYNKTGQYE